MSPRTWKHANYWLLAASVFLTVFCVIPGPGLWLASQIWYVTFISHLALVLAMLGVIAGARAEEKADA